LEELSERTNSFNIDTAEVDFPIGVFGNESGVFLEEEDAQFNVGVFTAFNVGGVEDFEEGFESSQLGGGKGGAIHESFQQQAAA
jgi:hypothetical protein